MKKDSTAYTIIKYILAFVFFWLVWTLCSCSTTRRIDSDDQLYTGLKGIKYETEPGQKLSVALKDEIHSSVFVAPNNYWKLLNWHYPFPLGLWVYNNWPNDKKGLRGWLYNKLAAEPVLVSEVRPDVRTHMVEQVLDNYGYFRGKAKFSLDTAKHNRKKASVLYTVYPGPAFKFRSVGLLPDTSRVNELINTIARRDSYLKSGNQYNTDSLQAARVRITNRLRTQGYYYFTPDFLEYLADSINHPGSIDLRLALGSNMPKSVVEPYKTGKVTVYINRPSGKSRQAPDTIVGQNATIIHQTPMRLRTQSVFDNVTFRPGRTFSVNNMDRTQGYLSRLGIYSSVTIDAIPDTVAARNGERVLDVNIYATQDKPLEGTVEVNASSKSNSYLGPGIVLGVTDKNIFGGGEQLSVKLGGSYEWQTGSNNKGGVFNSYEVSLTGSLAFPRLLAPKFIPRRRYQTNWTRFSLNGDILNRPHFFKMGQMNASMSYEWQAHRNVSMSWTPIKFTYTKLMHTTHDFDSIMAANPAVALSFRSQYIPQMMYTYVLDKPLNPNNRLNVSFTVQEAGNVFWAIYEACGKRGEKKLFGTPFSQFVKGQAQLVYGHRVGVGEHWLVMRGAVGAAHAYGNSSEVPYSEQFYCGGANSVRAFTVRSLGPGSYRAPGHKSTDYFDQTGTFKFEANIEYRFPIYGIFHGALFFDSGNVWLLKNDPARPGGVLRGKTFLKDLATGTGLGLRVDIGMLVVRGDLGIGIHAPYKTSKRGYYNMESFGKSLAFHLAIGYPF